MSDSLYFHSTQDEEASHFGARYAVAMYNRATGKVIALVLPVSDQFLGSNHRDSPVCSDGRLYSRGNPS